MTRRFGFAAAAMAVALLAVGCEQNLCGQVQCSVDKLCEPTTGLCTKNPNYDAGLPVVKDGGSDGGSDAGIDAGPGTCSPACAGALKCDPVSLTCVECVSNADCACPTPLCNGASKSCVVAPPSDAGAVVPAPGESCAEAAPLTFPSCGSTLSFQVDLNPLIDDESGTCSLQNALGRDAVYLVSLPGTRDVRVTAKPAPGSSAQPVPYLRLTPCETGPELACRDQVGAPSVFRVKSLPKGDYALVIDSFDSSSGGLVDVTVELLNPTEPGNETCATAAPIPLDGGSIQVNLALASDDLKTSCNATTADSREVVYAVQISEVADLKVTARGLDAGVDTVLSLRGTDCSLGTELVCRDTGVAAPESFRLRALEPGTYYLVVESYGAGGAGLTQVTASLSPPSAPPPNDTCAMPRVISFPEGQNSVSFTVDPSQGEDDFEGSCNSEPGSADLVYRFTLTSTRSVTLGTAAAAGSSADPVFFLRDSACTQGAELACVDELPGTPETLTRTLPAGDYFLFVEGYGAGGGGPTVLTVTLNP